MPPIISIILTLIHIIFKNMSHKCHKTKRRQPAPKKKKKRGNYD